MLQTTKNYSDERLRTNLVITEAIEKFLNENFQFNKMPKGYYAAKIKKPYVQITVHFPDHFEVGKETSLLYYQHCSPFNTIEHRFSFCPVEEKTQNTDIAGMVAKIKEELNICEMLRKKIDKAFLE